VFLRRNKLFLCTIYLTQPVIQAFGHCHAFVAGNEQLTRILLSRFESALFFFFCKRLVFRNLSRGFIVIFRLLDFFDL